MSNQDWIDHIAATEQMATDAEDNGYPGFGESLAECAKTMSQMLLRINQLENEERMSTPDDGRGAHAVPNTPNIPPAHAGPIESYQFLDDKETDNE